MGKKIILWVLAAALLLGTQLGNLRDFIASTHTDCEELIYDGLWEERRSIALAAYRMTPEELSDHWNHVVYDSAELFYVSDRYEYKAIGDWVLSVYPGYVATGKQLDNARTVYNDALEEILKRQGILNMCACIAVPHDQEDETLTWASVRFHEALGYCMVGRFDRCGCKFGRWYDMAWMEKHIGAHEENPADVKGIREIEV